MLELKALPFEKDATGFGKHVQPVTPLGVPSLDYDHR